jgi:methionyl-tRNA synthetase
MISIEDFKKVQLVVGRITSVADHPNASKLYVMQLDLGGETRQTVAGLKPYYQPEELTGKLVAVVANLEPVVLRGVESQAMILAAADAPQASKVVFLTPEKDMAPGSLIR